MVHTVVYYRCTGRLLWNTRFLSVHEQRLRDRAMPKRSTSRSNSKLIVTCIIFSMHRIQLLNTHSISIHSSRLALAAFSPISHPWMEIPTSDQENCSYKCTFFSVIVSSTIDPIGWASLKDLIYVAFRPGNSSRKRMFATKSSDNLWMEIATDWSSKLYH